jgi:hypothetical protein
VRVAVGRAGDQLVGQMEANECSADTSSGQVEIGEQAGNPLGQHGLADPRRPVEQHVVPATATSQAHDGQVKR